MPPEKNYQDDEHSLRILEFVSQYQQEHQCSPSYREIAEAVGLGALDHVHRDVKRLVKAGVLQITPGEARSVVVIGQPGVRAPAPPPAPRVSPSMRYRCTRCHIRIGTVSGLCEDCAEAKPLITYADAMGPERFYQVSRPRRNPYALQYDREEVEAGQTRRAYKPRGTHKN